MGDLTPLAWILIAAAFVVGAAVAAGLRRPKTIVEDADARRLDFLEREAAALGAKVESKERDNRSWAASHRALEEQLAAAKEAGEAATNPPELAEARQRVETLSAEVEELKSNARDVEVLDAELDTARGRAASLERELTQAKSVPQVPVEDFVATASLRERIAVLQGELDAARSRIALLETQLVSD